MANSPTIIPFFGLHKPSEESSGGAIKEVKRGGVVANYNPDLIAVLIDDHGVLLTNCSVIGALITKKKFSKIRPVLGEFRSNFFNHLVSENGIFYHHLKFHYTDDPDQLETIREFKRSMSGIQKVVQLFLIKWCKEKDLLIHIDEFISEFKGVGAALEKRMKKVEAALYPLYQAIPTVAMNSSMDEKVDVYVSS